jgi:hypothetical protein
LSCGAADIVPNHRLNADRPQAGGGVAGTVFTDIATAVIGSRQNNRR